MRNHNPLQSNIVFTLLKLLTMILIITLIESVKQIRLKTAKEITDEITKLVQQFNKVKLWIQTGRQQEQQINPDQPSTSTEASAQGIIRPKEEIQKGQENMQASSSMQGATASIEVTYQDQPSTLAQVQAGIEIALLGNIDGSTLKLLFFKLTIISIKVQLRLKSYHSQKPQYQIFAKDLKDLEGKFIQQFKKQFLKCLEADLPKNLLVATDFWSLAGWVKVYNVIARIFYQHQAISYCHIITLVKEVQVLSSLFDKIQTDVLYIDKEEFQKMKITLREISQNFHLFYGLIDQDRLRNQIIVYRTQINELIGQPSREYSATDLRYLFTTLFSLLSKTKKVHDKKIGGDRALFFGFISDLEVIFVRLKQYMVSSLRYLQKDQKQKPISMIINCDELQSLLAYYDLMVKTLDPATNSKFMFPALFFQLQALIELLQKRYNQIECDKPQHFQQLFICFQDLFGQLENKFLGITRKQLEQLQTKGKQLADRFAQTRVGYSLKSRLLNFIKKTFKLLLLTKDLTKHNIMQISQKIQKYCQTSYERLAIVYQNNKEMLSGFLVKFRAIADPVLAAGIEDPYDVKAWIQILQMFLKYIQSLDKQLRIQIASEIEMQMAHLFGLCALKIQEGQSIASQTYKKLMSELKQLYIKQQVFWKFTFRLQLKHKPVQIQEGLLHTLLQKKKISTFSTQKPLTTSDLSQCLSIYIKTRNILNNTILKHKTFTLSASVFLDATEFISMLQKTIQKAVEILSGLVKQAMQATQWRLVRNFDFNPTKIFTKPSDFAYGLEFLTAIYDAVGQMSFNLEFNRYITKVFNKIWSILESQITQHSHFYTKVQLDVANALRRQYEEKLFNLELVSALNNPNNCKAFNLPHMKLTPSIAKTLLSKFQSQFRSMEKTAENFSRLFFNVFILKTQLQRRLFGSKLPYDLIQLMSNINQLLEEMVKLRYSAYIYLRWQITNLQTAAAAIEYCRLLRTMNKGYKQTSPVQYTLIKQSAKQTLARVNQYLKNNVPQPSQINKFVKKIHQNTQVSLAEVKSKGFSTSYPKLVSQKVSDQYISLSQQLPYLKVSLGQFMALFDSKQLGLFSPQRTNLMKTYILQLQLQSKLQQIIKNPFTQHKQRSSCLNLLHKLLSYISECERMLSGFTLSQAPFFGRPESILITTLATVEAHINFFDMNLQRLSTQEEFPSSVLKTLFDQFKLFFTQLEYVQLQDVKDSIQEHSLQESFQKYLKIQSVNKKVTKLKAFKNKAALLKTSFESMKASRGTLINKRITSFFSKLSIP